MTVTGMDANKQFARCVRCGRLGPILDRPAGSWYCDEHDPERAAADADGVSVRPPRPTAPPGPADRGGAEWLRLARREYDGGNTRAATAAALCGLLAVSVGEQQQYRGAP
jgi:hypothetical protein